MELPYTIIAVVSATAAILSAFGSRRSSRVALMANGAGIEVSSGVYQRTEDTVGWLTLTNVGGSEARDVYIELFNRAGFDGRRLHRNPEPPVALWRESFIRRSTAIQIILPMLQFRAVGLDDSFELEPFTHAWVSYRDRLGTHHGYYLPIDHMSDPTDIKDLMDADGGEKESDDSAPKTSVLRAMGLATYPIDYAREWRRLWLVRRVVRTVGVGDLRAPMPRHTRMRMLKIKSWSLCSPRDFQGAFPETKMDAAPAIGMFSEDKARKLLWQGSSDKEARRMSRTLREMSSAIGDVEVVCYDADQAIIERFRLPCSFDVAQRYLEGHDARAR